MLIEFEGGPVAGRFVVARQNWKRLAAGFARLPGAVDVAAFDSSDEAAADRDRREAAAREAVNPFAWGDGLFDVTRLAPHALCDWLLEAGLSPPPSDGPHRAWAEWWERARRRATGEQAARVWEALDKLRLFAVEERPRRPGVFALTAIPWAVPNEDADYMRLASFEGGEPVAAYRTPDAAAAAGKWIAADRALRHDPYDYVEYDLGARARFAADPLGPPPTDGLRRPAEAGGVPEYDVTPVDLVADPDDARHLRRVAVVVRLGWSSEQYPGPDGFRWWRPASAGAVYGLPVQAFADRRAAEADAWGRDVAARRDLNPFRFGHPQDLTRLTEAAYRAMLADLDLDLPPGLWGGYDPEQQPAWAAWWERAAFLLTDDQRETVWDLLDQLRFHQVVELDLRG